MSNRLTSKDIYKNFELISCSWKEEISKYFSLNNLRNTFNFLENRLSEGIIIYPSNPFRAIHITNTISKINIVIIGQDPYHNNGQANGLAFSINSNSHPPPSLKNIYKELSIEYKQFTFEKEYNLISWANQGVLLLNNILTVEDSKPMSHKNKGWELFTDAIIKAVANDNNPKVFMLWGLQAQEKERIIKNQNNHHLILKANHPSPLSANRKPIPFIGCNHFINANRWLHLNKKNTIKWFFSKKSVDCYQNLIYPQY
ncbi:uracil-DNA glycosylase [Candidatus Kinetoplastibacterium desouzaii TCC079E]|uniref:Uracil-DNA glycosylase n=1 Tax=Candidatus Kinetoplastidibacterium desouzai TCC079E TaxID=1208919 RepID=M1LNF1_9PROT|nr:uracil-DNA glycosylase [Candidatus Kinetoplastibacterium desouzaii]AGF47222.1 uracil-DNA glycosylase [Candidatus Kinetoplastibacterium desouzaii TCC079E]